MNRIVTGFIVALFTSTLLNIGLFVLPAVASGGPYDWPLIGCDLASTGFSPSIAPNTNATSWIADMPAEGAGWWPHPIVSEGKVFIGLGGNLTAWNEANGDLIWNCEAPIGLGSPSSVAAAGGVVFCATSGANVYASNATTGEHLWSLTGGMYGTPPVIIGDRLYLGGGFTTGAVYCVNATNGAPIWSYSPTQDGVRWIAVAYGKVYVSCGSWETLTEGAIYCLDMYDGSFVWSFDTDRDYAGDLAVANGKVYFTASYEGWDCIVYALNATDGAVVWSTAPHPNSDAGSALVAYGKVFICLGYSGRGVYALDETNGDEIWAFPIIPEQPVPEWQNRPLWAAVADGKVFFGVSYPDHMFYAVSESTGAVIWSYRLAGAAEGRAGAIANGRVFVADHWSQKLYAFGISPYDWPMHGYDSACTSYSPSTAPNTNTTAWVTSLPGGTTWAYPVVAEGKVFIGAGGYLNAFDENTGGLAWSFSAPDQPGYPCCSAVADGKVFFGTGEPGPGGAMYALNTTTGDQIWKFPTEQYLRAPIVVDDRLYFGVDTDAPNTGKVYCLNATTGEHVWDFITQDKEVSVAVAYGKAYVGCGHWTTSATGCIYCLDMYDGSYIWSFQTNRDITGALAVANGKVYFTASYEGWDCIVYALNATDGAVVWSTTRYSDGSAGRTAVAYGKLFIHLGYYADGIYALNETNGDEIWASHVPSGGGPVIADGKVFFAKGNPANVFNAVNEATGAVIWSYVLSGGVHSATSAIANGRVFVADHWDPKLYAFGAPTAPPLSVSISPLSASIYMGQSVSFTSSVSGGAPLYNYQWYLNNNPVPSATSSGWTFTPTTPGTFTIYLNVTDSLSDSAKSNEATVTVASQLSTSISPMSASIFEGQSVTFASTASGGYTPYSYQWYLDGAPVSGATSASWTFTPATSGVYYVYLKLTDAKANTAQSDTARITVTAVPVGGYSIPIQAPTTAKPLTLCLMLTAILTIAFTTIKRKTTRKTKQPP